MVLGCGASQNHTPTPPYLGNRMVTNGALIVKKFVAVAGNIGVGKSTLVGMLCERLGWMPFYEPEADNPYLADFYQDMRAWAFHSQIFFLTHRLRAHKKIVDHPTSVVQDRCLYEDAEIFACNLYRQGLISDRDYAAYQELYHVLSEFLPPPDLVVYLRASVPTLQQRIYNRGREYERDISPEYLNQLNELYEDWYESFDLCPILAVPTDDLNYVAHSGHLDLMVNKVNEKLTGKEEVIFYPEEVANSRY
jgi:deoxyadenosine/deoxycytidine kinase